MAVPLPRAIVMSGRTYKLQTGCGNLYITVNRGGIGQSDKPNPHSGDIIEVFATIGKSGGCSASFLQGLTRMISLALRAGVGVDKVIRTLQGVGCPSPFWGNSELTEYQSQSCSDALAKVLGLESKLD